MPVRKAIEAMRPEPLKELSNKFNRLIQRKLWAQVLVALFLGVLVGVFLNPSLGYVDSEIAFLISEWAVIPGNLFLALIQMIVIPLIFASIIRGISINEDVEALKKSGVFVALFFLATTIIAILIGLFLAYSIQPGVFVSSEFLPEVSVDVANNGIAPMDLEDIPSMINKIIPTNIFSAMLNLQFFQIVIFSVIFGIALLNMGVKKSKPLLDLLASIQDVCITIVQWAMILVPIAVFGFMLRVTVQFGFDVLIGMSFYLVTVVTGLFIMFFFYLLLIYLLVKQKPLDFLRKTKDVLLLAFSTSSSAAVMPLSMRTVEEKLGVSSKVSNFVIPIGTTINMTGTALYQTVAVVFLTQVFGIQLALPSLLLIILTIIASSIGAPGTPGVGIVILTAILAGVGVPVIGIALILGFDRILDMLRTMINVTGDISTALILEKISSK